MDMPKFFDEIKFDKPDLTTEIYFKDVLGQSDYHKIGPKVSIIYGSYQDKHYDPKDLTFGKKFYLVIDKYSFFADTVCRLLSDEKYETPNCVIYKDGKQTNGYIIACVQKDQHPWWPDGAVVIALNENI